jgi:group I intron endonuclease
MRNYYLYQITNLLNNKKYIGITNNITKRWWAHRNRKTRTAISGAIQKYGLDQFYFEILIIGSRDYILTLEQQYIKEYSTRAPNGYNLTDGGEGSVGCNASSEHLRRMARMRTGIPLTPEHRQKISQSETGKFVSLETRNNIRLSLLRRFSDPNERKKLSLAHLGKKPSMETRLKMSQSQKHGGDHPNARAVVVEGTIYSSIKEASNKLNINYGTLISRINRGLHPDKYRYL